MYFRLGGGTLKGVSKPGWIVWSRVYVVDETVLKFDTGLAEVVGLPEAETRRPLAARPRRSGPSCTPCCKASRATR